MKHFGFGMLAAALLVGCAPKAGDLTAGLTSPKLSGGGKVTTASPEKNAQRYQTVADQKLGFSLQVPGDWAQLDMKSQKTQSAMTSVEDQNPSLKIAKEQMDGLVMAYVDRKTSSSMNVTSMDIGVDGQKINSEAIEAFKGQLAAQFPTGVTTGKETDLPAGHAGAFTVEVNLKRGDSTVKMREWTYVLLKGSRLFYVTYTALDANVARFEPVFDKSIKTFSFTS